MHKNLSHERIGLVLGGLLALACDKKPETPEPEPAASATAKKAEEPAATDTAKKAEEPAAVATNAEPVVAKEVPPAASASAGAAKKGGKEKKCAPGACAPGKCG